MQRSDSTARTVERVIALASRAVAPDGASGAGGLDKVRLSQRVAQMGQDDLRREAPVREILARVGDKWSPLLLLILEAGKQRNSTLRRLVGALSREGRISQRMLTYRLRSLERDGLVSRCVGAGHPVSVCYSLTALGRQLVAHIDGVINWTRAHIGEIAAARERFDAPAPAPDPVAVAHPAMLGVPPGQPGAEPGVAAR